MKRKFVLILAAAVLLCTGCVSIPEPSEKNDVLLYGIVHFNYDNYPNNYGFPEKYETKENIKLQFRNMDTKKIFTIESRHDGEIYKTNIPAGTYRLEKLSFRHTNDRAYSNYRCTLNQNSSTFYFIADKGVVNLGTIFWTINHEKDRYFITWKTHYEDAFNMFKRKYPDSYWLYEEWTNSGETLGL